MAYSIRVLVNGSIRAEDVEIYPDETVGAVDERLTAELSLAATHRLLVRGKALSDPTQRFPRDVSVLYVIESSEAAVAAVKAAKPDPLVRGFSSKPSKYAARPAQSGASVQSASPYKFHSLRPLPGYADKHKARELLETLANDPGFLRVMEERRYSVGCLAEMEPEGKVGVDPVCVLGLNVNKGQEILLRLRTDDKKGFRPMYMLKQVLAHELAHNVFSEHDADFFDLMRNIEREAKQYDWRESGGRAASGASLSASSRPVIEGRDPLDTDGEAGPSLNIVQRLGSGPAPSEGGAVSIGRAGAPSTPPSVGYVGSGVVAAEPLSSRMDLEDEDGNSDETASPSSTPEPEESSERPQSPLPTPSILASPVTVPSPVVDSPSHTEDRPKPLSDLHMLMSMGFSECMAKVALKECGSDAARAADWLLNLSIDDQGDIDSSDAGSDVGGDAGTQVRLLKLALANLAQEAGDDPKQQEEAFMTLYLYVHNLLTNPNTLRFREINGANAAFARRVGRFTAGAEVMRAIGYTLQDSGRWLLDGSVDMARVWVAKSLLVQTLYRHSRQADSA